MSNRVAAPAVVVEVFLLAYLGQHGSSVGFAEEQPCKQIRLVFRLNGLFPRSHAFLRFVKQFPRYNRLVHIRDNYPIFFGDGFPLLTAVGWRVLPSLHHASYIDFVLQHKLHISPRPEVAEFKLAIPFRVVLAETCVFLGG